MDNCAITWDTVNVTVVQDCNTLGAEALEAPNVFTPNADGVNDVWEFKLPSGCTLSGVEVYNRWGIEILNDKLEMKNVITWSGRTTSGEACSDGVYFYTLEYLDAKGDKQKKNGYVTLIR